MSQSSAVGTNATETPLLKVIYFNELMFEINEFFEVEIIKKWNAILKIESIKKTSSVRALDSA